MKIIKFLLLLLLIFFGYGIFIIIHDINLISNRISDKTKDLLILNNNKFSQNDNLITALPNSPFQKLNLNAVAKKLVPSQEFIQV